MPALSAKCALAAWCAVLKNDKDPEKNNNIKKLAKRCHSRKHDTYC